MVESIYKPKKPSDNLVISLKLGRTRLKKYSESILLEVFVTQITHMVIPNEFTNIPTIHAL